MEKMTPDKFSNHDDWLLYVQDNVPAQERPYALACGRTELFKSFYEVRSQTFPLEFAQEFERTQALRDPERTSDLEELNGRIFANLTEDLFNQARGKAVEGDTVISPSARQQIQRLLDHLTEKNPYFALWVMYKRKVGGDSVSEDWEEYLHAEIEPESCDDLVFARGMAELDQLLLYFRSRDLSLPKYFFERAWFLHYLREPERMVQTRALLNTLTAEIGACTSA
jgi:hypothetical protein